MHSATSNKARHLRFLRVKLALIKLTCLLTGFLRSQLAMRVIFGLVCACMRAIFGPNRGLAEGHLMILKVLAEVNNLFEDWSLDIRKRDLVISAGVINETLDQD